MILIRPKAIDDAALSSSNIAEAVPAAWSGGTTYATGDTAAIITGTVAALYRSLQSSNLNHSPATSPEWWVADGTAYSAWSGAVTYALGDIVTDTTGHRIYESLQGSNLNNPLTSAAFWLDYGPTNRWAMFDNHNGSTTSHPWQIDNTLQLAGRINSIALLNLVNAVSVRVIISTAADGTVYDESFPMISTGGINDWYVYFFETIETKSTLLLTGLPPYTDPLVQIIIDGDGAGNVECGLASIGLSKSLGKTLHSGAQIGITDYSRKTTDAFGNYTITERAFSKKGSFRMRMPKSSVDSVHAILAEYRATPAVYSATEDYGATVIFGFFRDFNIEIDYPLESLCSIEIEGLT